MTDGTTPTPATVEKQPLDPAIAALLGGAKSYVVYGQAKTQKSGQVAEHFQRGMYLLSSPNVHLGFASYIARSGVQLKLPKSLVINEFERRDGSDVRIDNWAAMQAAIALYIRRTEEDPGRYDCLVIDEATTFAKRWAIDLQNIEKYPELRSPKTGNYDMFRAQDAINGFIRRICQGVVQATKTNVVLVCHEVGPKFDSETGVLKALGGPDFLTQGQSKDATHDADATLRFFLKETLDAAPESWIRTAPHPEWRCGTRGDGLDPEFKGKFTDLMRAATFG